MAVGWAGLRLAANRAELIDAVRHIHGVDVASLLEAARRAAKGNPDE